MHVSHFRSLRTTSGAVRVGLTMLPLLLARALAADPASPPAAPAPVTTSSPSASPPAAGPDPSLEGPTVLTDYADWARKHKLKGPAAQLACSPFADGLNLCFTRKDGDNRVYYTGADGKTADQLRADAKGTEDAAVAGFAPVYVDNYTFPYYLDAGDVRADAALLYPDALERKVGGKCVVAVPAQGVVIAWVAGDLDFDKIVAVGVKRMYETMANPISSVLYTWDGKRWVVWGQAKDYVAPSP